MSLLSFRDIAKIFEEIELRLIASLKRNLSRHKAEEEKKVLNGLRGRLKSSITLTISARRTLR